MTHLYLVRHGETVWNREQRYQGQEDVPLSEKGRNQARCLAAALKDRSFDRILASDLSRAHETAEMIAEPAGIPVETDPRLREMSFGRWEGLTHPEILARYPEEWESYRADPAGGRAPGGESMTEVQKRAMAVMEEALAEKPGHLLVVSHGALLKAVICALLDLDLSYRHRLIIDNTGLSIVKYRPGRSRLLRFNDTCHL